jgi:hypothetical protein
VTFGFSEEDHPVFVKSSAEHKKEKAPQFLYGYHLLKPRNYGSA